MLFHTRVAISIHLTREWGKLERCFHWSIIITLRKSDQISKQFMETFIPISLPCPQQICFECFSTKLVVFLIFELNNTEKFIETITKCCIFYLKCGKFKKKLSHVGYFIQCPDIFLFSDFSRKGKRSPLIWLIERVVTFFHILMGSYPLREKLNSDTFLWLIHVTVENIWRKMFVWIFKRYVCHCHYPCILMFEFVASIVSFYDS